jgi:hypothetical protein
MIDLGDMMMVMTGHITDIFMNEERGSIVARISNAVNLI